MSHIALEAAHNRLPKGPCRVCDKTALRKNLADCRRSAPLNGSDAVEEFTRHLLPSAKARLLSVAPVVAA